MQGRRTRWGWRTRTARLGSAGSWTKASATRNTRQTRHRGRATCDRHAMFAIIADPKLPRIRVPGGRTQRRLERLACRIDRGTTETAISHQAQTNTERRHNGVHRCLLQPSLTRSWIPRPGLVRVLEALAPQGSDLVTAEAHTAGRSESALSVRVPFILSRSRWGESTRAVSEQQRRCASKRAPAGTHRDMAVCGTGGGPVSSSPYTTDRCAAQQGSSSIPGARGVSAGQCTVDEAHSGTRRHDSGVRGASFLSLRCRTDSADSLRTESRVRRAVWHSGRVGFGAAKCPPVCALRPFPSHVPLRRRLCGRVAGRGPKAVPRPAADSALRAIGRVQTTLIGSADLPVQLCTPCSKLHVIISILHAACCHELGVLFQTGSSRFVSRVRGKSPLFCEEPSPA